MIIEINNSLKLITKHNLQKISELIRDNILEVSGDNLINWKNVWCVLEKKEMKNV